MSCAASQSDFDVTLPEHLYQRCHFVEHNKGATPAYNASLYFGYRAPDEKSIEHAIIASSLESLIDQLERAPACDCDYCKITLAQQTIVRREQTGSASKKDVEQALRLLVHYGNKYGARRAVDVVQEHLNGEPVPHSDVINAALSIAQDCIVELGE